MSVAPLTLERTIAASSETVWKALTSIETLKKWQPYFTEFKPEVGFVTRFYLGSPAGRPYLHVCEVTEVDEGKKITYSWRYEGYPGDSYVTYELAPMGKRTKLTLTHRITEPFPASNPDFASDNFTKGWTNILITFIKFMEK